MTVSDKYPRKTDESNGDFQGKEFSSLLGLREKIVIGAFTLSYMTLAFFLSRMMDHSTWLIWASLVSFLVTTWTVWVEFAPKNMEQLRATRPLVGVRFLGGLSAAFYLFLFCRVAWYLTGSAPYLIDSEMVYHLLLVGMLLHFPFSIWASGMVAKRKKANR